MRRLIGRQSPSEELPVPGVRDVSEIQIEAIIHKLQESKRESFLDMVPAEHRDWVVRIAADAYPTRGFDRSVGEFQEDMALNWLAKRELFTAAGKTAGFTPVGELNRNADTMIMALTKSASILFATKPSENGVREIGYGRIGLREYTTIPTFNTVCISEDLRLGGRFITPAFKTAPLIDLLVNPDAGVDVKRTAADLTQGFMTVDHMTRI